MSACFDDATRKPIQYNTYFIVFYTVMFHLPLPLREFRIHILWVMLLAFSGSVHLVLYFISLV